MNDKDKAALKLFIRHLRDFREEIIKEIPEEEPTTLTLKTSELCTIVYALGNMWLGEILTAQEGYQRIMTRVSEVSNTIMDVEMSAEVDRAINAFLGTPGKENPETEGDGA